MIRKKFTLRQRFFMVVGIIFLVSIILLLGLRWLKLASSFRFHERQHHHAILQIDKDITLVMEGGLSSKKIQSAAVIANMELAQDIARRAMAELTAPEKSMFRLMEFGVLVDLASQNIEDLERVKRKILARNEVMVTHAMVQDTEIEIEKIYRNEALFTAELTRALSVIVIIVPLLCLLGIASILIAVFFTGRTLLREIGGEPSVARKFVRQLAQGNLNVEMNLGKAHEGSLLAAMLHMQSEKKNRL